MFRFVFPKFGCEISAITLEHRTARDLSFADFERERGGGVETGTAYTLVKGGGGGVSLVRKV
jgi:hypothetical protein